jgi:hypothetical protein
MLQFGQRENVRFCQKLGKSASEMFQMIKRTAKKPWIVLLFKWHKRFPQRRESLEDDEHAGRPRTVRTELKIQEVAMLVHANR